MNFQNIFEGIIASLIATVISGSVVFLYSRIKGKSTIMKGNRSSHFDISKINAFAVGLFLTVFFAILSLAGFYWEWAKFPSLVAITIGLGFLTGLIYQNQCPHCKKIFTKKHVGRETIKEEKIPHEYYDTIVYLFTDGTVKDRVKDKKKKKWVEIVRVIKDYFTCTSCKHNWDSSLKQITMNESDRPKPIVKKTQYRNPELDDIFRV